MRYHNIMVQMVRQRAAINPLACLTVFTVTGITWAKILQEGDRLDVNGNCTTTNDILSHHPKCKRLKSQRHVSTGFPDARMKRKRRVAFSREDNVEDDFLWPFWETFQEYLSGNAEGYEKNPEHLHIQQLPPAGTLAQDYGRESAVRQAGRHLASIGPAMDLSLYPNGGTYHHPIAVFLVSGDGSLVYYTTDGTPPDEMSSYVTSGDLIVVENSVTVRAVAVHKDSPFALTASSEVEATFVIHSAGKCGYAYFVPHFTRSGYSGKIVEVDLRTNALGSVRLRNVVTDFADFYAAGGVGPYDGQVVINDLVVDGDKGLAGYWGGFSGDVDGTSLGFLSPHYNGNDFHGKAVKIQLNNFRANTTRLCNPDGGLESNATCLFSVIDLEKIDPDLRGFNGGFLYDKKAYFVPFQNGRGAGAKFVRISASNFSADSVEILDLRSVDPGVGGFFGGFASEGYGYLVPSRSFRGPVGGVNSNLGADGSVSVPGFLGNDYSSVRKPAGRLEPAYSGKLVRVDLADFSSSGVEVLDLTVVDPDLRGFTGGFVAGHWGFLVPFKSKEGDGEFSGKMVRFDLRTFDYAGVTVLDLTRVNESLRGFVGGFVHGRCSDPYGKEVSVASEEYYRLVVINRYPFSRSLNARYAVLSPYANGNITSNYRSRSQFSLMVVVDLQDFSEKGVSVVDLAETSRQQVPYQPDPNLRGYVGGFALGPHVYLTPHFNGIFFGKVVRVDMREILTMAAGERASRYDGLQVLDLALESADAVGFSGAFHSWDTSCS